MLLFSPQQLQSRNCLELESRTRTHMTSYERLMLMLSTRDIRQAMLSPKLDRRAPSAALLLHLVKCLHLATGWGFSQKSSVASDANQSSGRCLVSCHNRRRHLKATTFFRLVWSFGIKLACALAESENVEVIWRHHDAFLISSSSALSFSAIKCRGAALRSPAREM